MLKSAVARLGARYVAGVRRHGVLRSVPLAFSRAIGAIRRHVGARIHARTYERRLAQLAARIRTYSGFIDTFHVPMGWHTPLFQRFQHMSLQAAHLGGLALYGAHPLVDRDVLVYEEVEPNVLIFDAMDRHVVEAVLAALRDAKGPKIVRIQSIDLATTPEEVDRLIAAGLQIVYEYIDELTEHITGAIPAFVFDRHRKLLSDDRVLVVATSDKLHAEVRAAGAKRCLLSTNGVDPDFWRIRPSGPPADLLRILETARPVVAYHGAIARWIDVEIIRKLAECGEFEVLLIGYEHDKHLRASGLLEHAHVHFLGARQYKQLPQYAFYYDVAILPFERNAVTEAVSPVKLFEYMAAGKPVVTTDLPECRKYRSCLIGATPGQFVEQVRAGLRLRSDPDYQRVLAQEANVNSWTGKARDVYAAAGIEL